MAPNLAAHEEGRVMPNLDELMRYWVSLLGLDRPDPVSKKPWAITWGWVDSIEHPNGGEAVGLNQGDGDEQTAHIQIRRPRSQEELAALDDTTAHEVAHCVGRRVEALWNAGLITEGHEYLAETLAPAFVQLRGTPKAAALAKALQQWPKRALMLAKAANMPARAEGTRMDIKAILAMIALIAAASTPEEKEKLLGELKVQLEAQAGNAEGATEPPSVAKPPEAAPAAQAPAAPEKDKPGADMGMSEEERLMKSAMFKKEMAAAVDAIIEARSGLTDEQKGYAKTLGTPERVRAYFKTIPLAKPEPKPDGADMGLQGKPRGGAGNTGSAPSADAKVNALFRILPGDENSDGVIHYDPRADGHLVGFSVVGAYAKIKNDTKAAVEQQRARMTRGAA